MSASQLEVFFLSLKKKKPLIVTEGRERPPADRRWNYRTTAAHLKAQLHSAKYFYFTVLQNVAISQLIRPTSYRLKNTFLTFNLIFIA